MSETSILLFEGKMLMRCDSVTDWPANVLLGIETSIVDYVSSLDGLGYPYAVSLSSPVSNID